MNELKEIMEKEKIIIDDMTKELAEICLQMKEKQDEYNNEEEFEDDMTTECAKILKKYCKDNNFKFYFTIEDKVIHNEEAKLINLIPLDEYTYTLMNEKMGDMKTKKCFWDTDTQQYKDFSEIGE